MWEYGEPRGDGWGLIVIVSDTGPFTDDEIPGLLYLTSTDESQLVGSGTQEAGSIQFEGLAVDSEQSQAVEEPMELAGTIEWSCEG